MKAPRRLAPLAAAVLLPILAGGCSGARPGAHTPAAAVDRLASHPRSPHDDYAAGLRDAGLAATALGNDWLVAGRSALATASSVSLPHREVGIFDGARPGAIGWRLELVRGLTLVAETSLDSDQPTRLFLDLLRWDGTRWLAAAASDDGSLHHVVERDGTYALRLQPELLRGGRWALTLSLAGGLAFPVPGAEASALIGRFGDPRDGGARRHEGIDIPAPRGTPAVAAADALVTAVTTNTRGGNVVWLADDRGRRLYYAHLDAQLVRPGQRLRTGDVVGRVGNTGNAAGTAPHLHFGVFARGAVDPLPLLVRQRMPPPPLAAAELLGAWGRVRSAAVRLRTGPSTASAIQGELPAGLAVAVTGASADWLRVTLPDARHGWVHASLVEPAREPLFRLAARDALLLTRPVEAAPATAVADEDVPVLGTAPGWLLVGGTGGRTGWLPDPRSAIRGPRAGAAAQ
jgi:peptidoglycan LD-endopeptidase LytH